VGHLITQFKYLLALLLVESFPSQAVELLPSVWVMLLSHQQLKVKVPLEAFSLVPECQKSVTVVHGLLRPVVWVSSMQVVVEVAPVLVVLVYVLHNIKYSQLLRKNYHKQGSRNMLHLLQVRRVSSGEYIFYPSLNALKLNK
jgi:hypothetical protein